MLPIADGHLDLAYLAERGVDLLAPTPDPDAFSVNLPSLDAGGVRLVFATIFTESISAPRAAESWEYHGCEDIDGAFRAGRRQLERYLDLERRGSIRIVRSRRDLEPLDDGGPLRVVLLMEGADPIRAPKDFDDWFERGVRIVALAWALGSRYSGGNAAPGPITPAGARLLERMAQRGAMLDVSHLPDQAFDEALHRFAGAVLASHSNCRALLEPTERHLNDDQIRRLAERDGAIGLNLFGRFLASGRTATLEDAIAHARRLIELAGPERVGLGSDLDGGFSPRECPEGLRRPEDFGSLIGALAASGVDDRVRRSFACGSWLRLLRRSLPA